MAAALVFDDDVGDHDEVGEAVLVEQADDVGVVADRLQGLFLLPWMSTPKG